MHDPMDCALEEASADPAAEGFPPHPLFPRAPGSTGPETRDIYMIEIHRWNHHGIKEKHPIRYPSTELTSWEQIVEQWGGGTYQLAAYTRKSIHAAWTQPNDKFFSPEPCKPFWPQSAQQPVCMPSAPAPALAPAPAAPSPGPQDAAILMFQQVMREASADRAEALREAAAARAETARLYATLLERLAAPAHLPPAAPAPDPIAQLTGLATVAEKLRAPSSGIDPIAQLSSLLGLAKQMNRGVATTPASLGDDEMIKPLMNLVTAFQQQAAAPAATSAQAPAMSSLVQVFMPGIGPVQMTSAQAQAFQQYQAQQYAQALQQPLQVQPSPAPAPVTAAPPPPPAVPLPAATPTSFSMEAVVDLLAKNPTQLLAFQRALERRVAPPEPAVHATPAAVTPETVVAPVAPTSSAQSFATPAAPVPAPTMPEASAPPPAPIPAAPVAPEAPGAALSAQAALDEVAPPPLATSTMSAAAVSSTGPDAPVTLGLTPEQIRLALEDPELRAMLPPDQVRLLEELHASGSLAT